MTTRPTPRTPADPDTFEARWGRSVAKEIKREQAQDKRGISTLLVIVATAAVVAAWVFTLQ